MKLGSASRAVVQLAEMPRRSSRPPVTTFPFNEETAVTWERSVLRTCSQLCPGFMDHTMATLPVTNGVAIDVPSQVALIEPRSTIVSWYWSPGTVDRIFTPGAASCVVLAPQLEKPASWSPESVAATV